MIILLILFKFNTTFCLPTLSIDSWKQDLLLILIMQTEIRRTLQGDLPYSNSVTASRFKVTIQTLDLDLLLKMHGYSAAWPPRVAFRRTMLNVLRNLELHRGVFLHCRDTFNISALLKLKLILRRNGRILSPS